MPKSFYIENERMTFNVDRSHETAFGIRNVEAALPHQNAFLVGHTICTANYYCHFENAMHTCLMYFCKGKGWLRHGNTLYYPQKGDLFLLHKDVEWEFAADSDDPWELYWINSQTNAENDFIVPLLHYYGLSDVVHVTATGALPLMRRCYDLLADRRQSPQVMQSSFFLTLFQLVEYIKSRLLPDEPHTTRQRDALRMKEHIDANIELPLTVEKVSAIVFRSIRSASAIFKTYYGIPLKEYILQAKLAVAADLLTGTTHPVGEIAVQLSFCDVYHFSKIFTAKYGVSPLRYRKRMQGEKG